MATNYVLVDFENVQPDMSALAGTANKVVVFFGAKQQEGRVKASTMLALIRLGPNVKIVELLRSGKNALDMHIAFHVGQILVQEPEATIHIVSGDTDFDPLVEYLKKIEGTKISRSKDIGPLAKQRPMPAVPAMGAVPRKAKAPAGGRRSSSPKAPQAQRAAQPQRVARPQNVARPQKGAPPQRAPQQHKLPPPQVLLSEKKMQPGQYDQIVKQLRSMTGKPSTRKKLEQTIASYFKHHGGEWPELIQQAIDELIRGGIVMQTGTRVTYSLG
jgi:hypothetical protein